MSTYNVVLLKKYAYTILCSVVFFSASFSLVHNVPDWQITGKWIGTIAAVAISGIILSITFLFKPKHGFSHMIRACSFSMVVVNLAVAVYCLLQLSGLVDNCSLFRAVADFDNPAGVADLFCVTFPFILIVSKNKARTLLVVALFVIDTSILFAIESRVGLVTMTVSAVVWLVSQCIEKRIRYGLLVLVTMLIAAAIGGVIFLFYHKIPSTNGRVVIFNTCIRMVAEHPLFGFGFGGFGREYMNWQAEYLKTIENENILMLSDNVTHPLSEFILVAVNSGLAGLSIIMATIAFAVVHAFICLKMGQCVDAETHYKKASYMCPSRITPLYRLFLLYEEQGSTANMFEIGYELLDKPLKVASHDARSMRLDVKRKLFNYQ